MPLKITRADEPLEVKRIVMTLMGEPGVGKTSLAFTASNPVLLDFDKGAYRATNRKDSVQIESWAEVASISNDDLADYDTLIIDTGGRALDFLSGHLMKEDGKLATRAGALTLQGYGALKSVFKQFLDRLTTTCDVDVVILAHAVEEMKNDTAKVRVDMQGGSRDEIYKLTDQLGFLRMHDRGRWLSYDPEESGYGKNSGQVEPGWVPHPQESPTLLADHITQIKRHLNEGSELQRVETQRLTDLREWVDKIGDAEALTELARKMIVAKAKRTDRKIVAERAKELGFQWNADDDSFIEQIVDVSEPEPEESKSPESPDSSVKDTVEQHKAEFDEADKEASLL